MAVSLTILIHVLKNIILGLQYIKDDGILAPKNQWLLFRGFGRSPATSFLSQCWKTYRTCHGGYNPGYWILRKTIF